MLFDVNKKIVQTIGDKILVNLQNNANKPIRIFFVVVHRILTVLNINEGFIERSMPYLTCIQLDL